MVDFYPTLADLCGLSNVPTNLHGKSLRPLLDNPNATWDRPAISQMRRGGGAAADQKDQQKKKGAGQQFVHGYSIRTERYRFTEWADGKEGEEMYDYQTDPKELKNLATSAAHAKVKEELRTRLRSITKERGRA